MSQNATAMSEAAEHPIERLAGRLQRLAPEVRWLVVNLPLVRARALGREPLRGPREKKLNHLIIATERFGLQRWLVLVVNLALLVATYVAQRRTPVGKSAVAPLFIGIAAMREPALVARFEARVGTGALCIDERYPSNFFKILHVPLFALLAEWLQVWSETSRAFRLAVPEGLEERDLYTNWAMRGHWYTYVRAWFRCYFAAPNAANKVACTAVSEVAFAAVAVGGDVEYMMHGFQRYSIIYPDFARCESFNAFDAEHLQRRLPDCDVRLFHEPSRLIETKRVAAIAGTYYSPGGFDQIRPFIDWARQHGIPVVVREHPADQSGYWDAWQDQSLVKIDKEQRDFYEFLATVRPRVLATWHSTTLLDALASNIIPLTVVHASGEAEDVVFPMREIALCWPEDEDELNRLFEDRAARDAVLCRRWMRITGSQPAPVPGR